MPTWRYIRICKRNKIRTHEETFNPLIIGMVLVVIGALLKINGNNLSQYVLITGLVIEVYVLATLVIQSLKK